MKMDKILNYIVPIAVAFLLVNCSTTKISNLDAFKPVDAEMAEVMPSKEELSGQKVKIAVYDIEDLNEASKRANVAEKLNEQVKKYLIESNVEIVDREAAGKYKDEIILATQASSEFKGPQFASYVIQGKITNVSFSVELGNVVSTVGSALTVFNYLNDGKVTNPEAVVEEACQYSAKISGNLTLYSLPDLKVERQFLFSDEETKDIAPQRGINSGGDVVATIFTGKVPGDCPVNKELVDGLVNSAASESIRKGRLEMQNTFAPKGYVESIFRDGDQYIAKITIGKKAGLKEGSLIEIFTYDMVTNNLSGDIERNDKKISEGIVSDQIGESHAWIILSDTDQAKKIRIGDFIKVRFEKGTFENFGDILG